MKLIVFLFSLSLLGVSLRLTHIQEEDASESGWTVQLRQTVKSVIKLLDACDVDNTGIFKEE